MFLPSRKKLPKLRRASVPIPVPNARIPIRRPLQSCQPATSTAIPPPYRNSPLVQKRVLRPIPVPAATLIPRRFRRQAMTIPLRLQKKLPKLRRESAPIPVPNARIPIRRPLQSCQPAISTAIPPPYRSSPLVSKRAPKPIPVPAATLIPRKFRP